MKKPYGLQIPEIKGLPRSGLRQPFARVVHRDRVAANMLDVKHRRRKTRSSARSKSQLNSGSLPIGSTTSGRAPGSHRRRLRNRRARESKGSLITDRQYLVARAQPRNSSVLAPTMSPIADVVFVDRSRAPDVDIFSRPQRPARYSGLIKGGHEAKRPASTRKAAPAGGAEVANGGVMIEIGDIKMIAGAKNVTPAMYSGDSSYQGDPSRIARRSIVNRGALGGARESLRRRLKVPSS